MARRLSIGLVLTTLVIALAPSIAAADIDGDCSGEAIIRGQTYTPERNDTAKTAIPIPNEDGVQATYSGSVGFENLRHEGSAKVQVGPFGITLGDWGGSNEDDQRGVSNQVYEIDDFRDKLPIWVPGVWRVSATHSASGGDCSGFAMVKLEGNALGNAVGWIALIGLIGTAYVAINAALKKRMTSAVIAALFLGLFLAVLLMMFGVRPLDAVTTVVLPVALAIAAGVLALTRPRSAF